LLTIIACVSDGAVAADRDIYAFLVLVISSYVVVYLRYIRIFRIYMSCGRADVIDYRVGLYPI
jgi:hypothetical protein